MALSSASNIRFRCFLGSAFPGRIHTTCFSLSGPCCNITICCHGSYGSTLEKQRGRTPFIPLSKSSLSFLNPLEIQEDMYIPRTTSPRFHPSLTFYSSPFHKSIMPQSSSLVSRTPQSVDNMSQYSVPGTFPLTSSVDEDTMHVI